MQSPTYILAIESSCDDTSVAVLKNTEVLSNVICTQNVHEEFGGVVPELASREHQKNIVPTVFRALKQANINLEEIAAIGFTRGPGLMGSLLVGVSFVKGLSLALNKPLIEVNHMQAHILAHFAENNKSNNKPKFPFLCLTVSGGHTQIVLVKSVLDFELIGQTKDDAAGEAFDKVAKIMGLPYPGGPVIDKLAKQGNPNRFKFPIASIPDHDFSFSGLKTAILYFLRDSIKEDPDFIENNQTDICASIQYTIVKTLILKLEKASKDLNIKQIAIAGGVSANSELREALTARENSLGWETYIPNFEFCTDNAAMIGISAYFKYLKGDFTDLSVIPEARMKL
ncbi:MAG: tRNA (adenosine(37)-N6)-threonylcarbamoyltransferase complex transferase subunit TsaD [Crocinitomicaceae bacterium]|nr:tRNA (adenosine(37)-N6)-threonylcarbamoyltransferase complex transferase subunit TsaD [Crocinitomicaceae bacterium]